MQRDVPPEGEVEREADDRLYVRLAAAYARDRLGLVADAGDDDAVRAARAASLRLHPWKRTALERVRRVLGVLRGLSPRGLLDLGSGRGAFLWPLLDAFPGLRAVSVDRDARGLALVAAVARGGVPELSACRADVRGLPFGPRSFDVVTVLEVLEHLHDPAHAAAEALRVARRFVVATVPSRPDDNPEHVQLFTRASLTELFRAAGARRVQVTFVLNHMVAVVGAPDG